MDNDGWASTSDMDEVDTGKESLTTRLRRRFVDAPESIGARKRAQRWEQFEAAFPKVSEMTVIDLGGTADAWRRSPIRPGHVTVLNLYEPGSTEESWLETLAGDACDARQVLRAASRPVHYDLAFSNSVIEHVGGHALRRSLATEVHALAPSHWVQTPYRYFPIEPHWLFPMLQFMPVALRWRVAAAWPLAHSRPADDQQAVSEVQSTELIGVTEMRSYFPTSEIRREKALGLTKSLIAVSTHPSRSID